jgi:4-diphosphocytidyl-2C-methyl-D-erythritol kinase
VEASCDNLLINDLEPPAFICEPLLKALKDDITTTLLAGSKGGVMMSGSGTSVYALLRKSDEEGERRRRSEAIRTVLDKYSSVRHFPCGFLSKLDDVKEWYKLQ